MFKNVPTIIKAWLSAIRPRTLPIPTIQVATAVAGAYAFTGNIHWDIAFFTWMIALFITIGTNLINDVIDYEQGGDPLNRFGHQKMISMGLLSAAQVRVGGYIAFIIAILCSISLSIHAGWIFSLIVILSSSMGYCYTGGPFPISYLGLSELFVFLFYGGVCVLASYYVQAQAISREAILIAAQLGCFAALPNALNNFRDMFEDAKIHKKTLAVRCGRDFSRSEIAFLTFFPFILNFFWIFLGYSEAFLAPLLLLPIAFLLVRGVWITPPGPIFNRYFGLCVSLHFLFGMMLILGFFLS